MELSVNPTESFQVEELEDFNPEVPVMSQDLYHMGTFLGSNAMALYPNHQSERMNYVILVDQNTGKRIKVTFPKE